MKKEDRREQVIQELRRWLEAFEWTWFVTLKLCSGTPSVRRAKRLCDQWLAGLEREEGGRDFRWFRTLEVGALGTIHFHIIVGGFRNRRAYWTRRWAEVAGDALITAYDPEQKGIFYLLKTTDNNGELDFDCELPKGSKS